MILGVEVREDAVIAVAADENGAITRRGRHDGANGSSAAAAIRVVLADASPSSVGVAVRDPFEPSVTDVVAAISAEELTAVTNSLQSTTFRSFEFYFVATAMYLAMAIGARLLLHGIYWAIFERRRPDERGFVR